MIQKFKILLSVSSEFERSHRVPGFAIFVCVKKLTLLF